MNFKEAEAEMDVGSVVKREGWPDGWRAFKTAVEIKGGVIEFRLDRPEDHNSTWEPQPADISAEDWIVIESSYHDNDDE